MTPGDLGARAPKCFAEFESVLPVDRRLENGRINFLALSNQTCGFGKIS